MSENNGVKQDPVDSPKANITKVVSRIDDHEKPFVIGDKAVDVKPKVEDGDFIIDPTKTPIVQASPNANDLIGDGSGTPLPKIDPTDNTEKVAPEIGDSARIEPKRAEVKTKQYKFEDEPEQKPKLIPINFARNYPILYQNASIQAQGVLGEYFQTLAKYEQRARVIKQTQNITDKAREKELDNVKYDELAYNRKLLLKLLPSAIEPTDTPINNLSEVIEAHVNFMEAGDMLTCLRVLLDGVINDPIKVKRLNTVTRQLFGVSQMSELDRLKIEKEIKNATNDLFPRPKQEEEEEQDVIVGI